MALTSSSVPFPARTTVQRWSLLRLLSLWHLLDLDAPTVAVVWTWSFGHYFEKPCSGVTLVVLSLGTWLLYAADRLLDGWRNPEIGKLRLRHEFHRRHTRGFLLAATGITGILLWLILTQTPESLFRSYGFLFAITLCYFLLVHLIPETKRNWLPKELLVGAIFAAATSIPTLLQFREPPQVILSATTLFAAVCWLNCAAIERWENGEGRTSRRFDALLGGLSASALFLTAFVHRQRPQAEGIFCAIFLSLATIALLDRNRLRIDKLWLRIAVDLALLTPALFLHIAS